MKNTRFLFSFILCCVTALTTIAPIAAQEIAPEAKAVIEKHIKSLGGRAKLEGVKSMVSKGVMLIPSPAGEMEAEIELFQKGNKFLMAMNMSTPQGDMEMQNGSDGETIWALQPPVGAMLIEGEQKAAAQDMYGQPFPSLGWVKYDGEIKNEGTEKVDGKECDKLVFTPKKGFKVTRYFDQETGHLVKVSTKQKNPAMGELDISYIHSDFKDVDGIPIAHKQVTDMGVAELTLELEDVKINTDVDDKKFELPDEIKELVKEKKEKEEKKDDQ